MNAILIDDESHFNVIEQTFLKHFNENNKLKIIRCLKLLEDVTSEEKLATLIEKEHLRNNHRGIEQVFKEISLNYYHQKTMERVTQFINNCEVCKMMKLTTKVLLKKKYQES